jgi:uncharacterized protein (TIGR04222 family)
MIRPCICVAVITAVLTAGAAVAQQPGRLDCVLSVNEDGSAIAVERLELHAPMYEPLHWRMATASTDTLGVRRLLFIEVLEVSDGRGNLVRTVTREYGDKLDILVPVQPLGSNTIRITYQILNAVLFREDRDELYWRLGAAWAEPIGNLTADLTVPGKAAGQVRGQFVSGGTNVRMQPLLLHGTTDSIESESPVEPAVDLVFAKGVLRPPSPARRAAWFLKANPIVLFPGILLLAMAGFRKYTRRSGNPQMSIATRYEPPEDLPPAEAGYLVDGRLDPRDIAAMLLDLARRGFIAIEPCEPDEGVPYSAPDFMLRLLKHMDDWKGAYSYEHMTLFHLFYGGQWTKLSSVSLRFYSIVPMISQAIEDELQQKRLYNDPRRVPAQRVGAVLVLAAVLWAAQAAGWFAVAQSGLLAMIAVLSFVIAVLLLTGKVDHRTVKGAQVFAELRGFETFLDSVEADRMKRITPELFETYLPYAVAFGVEHRWGAMFSTISSGPPLWWEQGKGGIPDFIHLVGSYARTPRETLRGQAAKATG